MWRIMSSTAMNESLKMLLNEQYKKVDLLKMQKEELQAERDRLMIENNRLKVSKNLFKSYFLRAKKERDKLEKIVENQKNALHIAEMFVRWEELKDAINNALFHNQKQNEQIDESAE